MLGRRDRAAQALMSFFFFLNVYFSSICLFLQCINEEGFRLFLKTYLEVEDFPVDLCQRLFRSFQNPEAAQEDAASKIIHGAATQQLLMQHSLINSCHGLVGMHSFITT